MDQDANHNQVEDRDERPEVELYDPFDRSFTSRKREDPLLRLYDKKVIGEDF